MSQSGRISWIDQAKGWGMLLVLVGHASPHVWVTKVVYSFHLPFFFALSGFLHNPNRHGKLQDLLQARWKTLLLPYFGYSLIGYFGLLLQWSVDRGSSGMDLLKPLTGTLFGFRNSSVFHGTLWFVACLFLTELIFHGLQTITRRRILLSLALALPLAAYTFHPLLKVPFFPWSIDASLVALVFFIFGRIVRQLQEEHPVFWNGSFLLVLVVATWIMATIWGGAVDMYTNRYDRPVLFVLGAWAGIILVFRIVPKIPPLGWIGHVGRHSLVYLALHQWLAFNIARKILSRSFPIDSTDSTLTHVAYSVLTIAISVAILWPICAAFDRWLPFLVGGGARRPLVDPKPVQESNPPS